MTQKISLDLVINHVKNNMEKERKQFNLTRKAVEQLNYIHDHMEKSNNAMSLSGIVERALDAYHSLYTFVEKLEEKK